MKKNILIPLAFAVVAVLLLNCAGKESTKESKEVSKKEYSGKLSEMSVYNLSSEWTNQNGENMQLKALRGNVVVAVMIYTSCTSACPILVEHVRDIHNKMSEKENKKIKYVFISIDPKDDTPEKLKAFAIKKEMDNPQYIFLRSSLDNTRTLSAVLGVNFKQVSKMEYKHSNIISVLDQNGVITHQQKGLDVNGDEVVAALKKLVK